MSISDVASLIGGAFLGAPVSEGFKLLLEQAKKVTDFKAISEDLASTLERLAPVFEEIHSMQQGSDQGELKFLIKTTQKAEKMVRKCSGVQWYNAPMKAWYTMKIRKINQDFFKFCQFELQLIQLRNQFQSKCSMASVTRKIDLLTDTAKGSAETFIVPKPKEVPLSWLDRPLRELKKMLLEDGVVTLVVVSAPSACGKTTLVTKLCHDTDVRGKFKHIIFITVSKAPYTRIIVQRLLQHIGCEANEFASNFDARLCMEQLLKQLGQTGSILVVLDDVFPEEEYFLEKFLIQSTNYKILVTSRVEFPTLGPTFQLERLIDEDVKNLFIKDTAQPNCLSCAKHDHLLQKILKRCNGSPFAINPPSSICDGCNSVIEHGRLVNVLGVVWHPECFCCDACHKPISPQEVEKHVSNRRGKFHKSCYRERRRPTCSVCKEEITSTARSMAWNEHEFWREKYCPSHEVDGTSKCSSCERLEPRGTNYVKLGDGRWICLECRESAIMDATECHDLHWDIHEFMEGLFLKVEQEFPLYLVEYQALNEGNFDPTGVVTRASCFSEELNISSVSGGPRMGSHNQLIDMVVTETETVSVCKINAIFILYGLPRLLTGYILAHEMMHAYLRLQGHSKLNNVLEEGICQVVGHMWLESQTYGTTDATAAAASSSHTPAATTSKKGELSDSEKKLAEFCKYQIQVDDSPYGVGFRKVNEMVTKSSLQETLKFIVGG